MREVIRYEIETRNPVTGYWEVKQVCICHYERKVTEHHFLFFTWSKSKIINKAEAELRCRERAMLWAFEIYKGEGIRVTITELINGHAWNSVAWNSVVWENGEWKDC